MKTIKHIIFIFLIVTNTANSQNNSLEKLRKQYCDAKIFKVYIANKKLIEEKSELPPPSPLN